MIMRYYSGSSAELYERGDYLYMKEKEMSHDTFMMLYYLIRGHADTKQQMKDEIMLKASYIDGLPRARHTADPTLDSAIRLAALSERIDAVEAAIRIMGEKYGKHGEFDAHAAFLSKAVFCGYRSKVKKEMAPCDKTYTRYRREFARIVGKCLNYL